MRKRNKLYTANKWNQLLFTDATNLYEGGGNLSFTPASDRAMSLMGGFDISSTSNSKNVMQGIDFMPKTPTVPTAESALPGMKSLASKLAPKPKTNFSGTQGDAIGAATGAVGAGINSLLSHGLNSKFSNITSGITNMAGDVIGKFNPMAKAAVQIGGSIISGVGNMIGGTKVDQERLDAANKGTAELNSFRSDASSFEGITGPKAVAVVQNAYSGGLAKKSWANRMNAALKTERADATSLAYRSVDNNVDNIANTQMDNILGNYAAFGGSLGENQGAINYNFMSDYLTAKNKAAGAKDKMSSNIFGALASPQSALFALGGDIQTNGSDFSNGLSEINAGGSHEQNPYQGVQVGISQENGKPNLVEEGETIFDDYVFSKRIKIDNKTKKKFHLSKHAKMSYADLSKRLQRESLERPNDAISQQGLSMMMHALADEQERQKAEMQAKEQQEAIEALPPEQQEELMRALAIQQEQQAQQAQQEQMQQQEATQQVQPEEQQMSEEQMQQMAQEQQMQQEQQAQMQGEGYACGGKINRFDNGGDTQSKRKSEAYNAIGGIYTDDDFDAWAKKNKVDPVTDWENIWQNTQFLDALKKINPTLRDAIARGYNFGNYDAPKVRYDFDDFKRQLAAYTKSKIAGNTEGNYAVDNAFDLGKHKTIQELENDAAYKGFTDYMTDVLRRNKGIAFKHGKTQDYDDIEWDDPDKKISREDYLALQALQAMSAGTSTNPEGKHFDFYNTYSDGYRQLMDDAADRWSSVRTDGKGGIFHFNPKVLDTNSKVTNYELKADGSVVPIYGDIPKEWKKVNNYDWQNPEGNFTANYFKRPLSDKDKDKSDYVVVPKHRSVLERSLGASTPLIDLSLKMAGVGKPDNSGFEDALLSYANGAPRYAHVHPIGNKLVFTPFDLNYDLNKLSAQANATNRAILNNSSPTATKNASMIANSYANQLATSNALRQAQEYNNGWRTQVADFNRKTDEFNAQAFNRASEVNAGIDNNRLWQLANLSMQVAKEKDASRASWYKGIYNDIASLGQDLSNIGNENARHNMIADMAATGILGTLKDQPISTDFIDIISREEYEKRKKNIAAKGGRLKRKKKGLTF